MKKSLVTIVLFFCVLSLFGVNGTVSFPSRFGTGCIFGITDSEDYYEHVMYDVNGYYKSIHKIQVNSNSITCSSTYMKSDNSHTYYTDRSITYNLNGDYLWHFTFVGSTGEPAETNIDISINLDWNVNLDSDGDGVTDAQEILDGTDPNNPDDFLDTDGDGVPDQVEYEQGTDPLNPQDFLDTDGDGVSDYVENKLGTDPEDSEDTPEGQICTVIVKKIGTGSISMSEGEHQYPLGSLLEITATVEENTEGETVAFREWLGIGDSYTSVYLITTVKDDMQVTAVFDDVTTLQLLSEKFNSLESIIEFKKKFHLDELEGINLSEKKINYTISLEFDNVVESFRRFDFNLNVENIFESVKDIIDQYREITILISEILISIWFMKAVCKLMERFI